ncbi:MAG: nucleoside-diphosphate sugar epimerase/dehydratase [Candidatus Anstonellales archaeon]
MNQSFIKKLLSPTHFKRFLFFLFSDIIIILVSLYLSFLIRFEFKFPEQYKILFLRAIPFFILFKLVCFSIFGLYRITWRYVSLRELSNLIIAAILSSTWLMIFMLLEPFDFIFKHLLDILYPSFLSFQGFPRSIFIIDGLITLLFTGGLRISKRLYLELLSHKKVKRGKRTIIIGAGNTGEIIIRDMARQGFSEFYPVALLDDDRAKIGAYIHGVKVAGSTEKLKETIRKYNAEAVIIAIPSLNYKTLRNIYSIARDSKVDTIKIIPRIYGFQKPDINLKALEDINIEDLIGRQEIKVNYKAIEEFLRDKVLLVTGAGGSIGSEIVFQSYAFQPKHIILFDIDETALHNMEIRLRRKNPELKLSFVVGDIKDKERVYAIFKLFKPEIIFHAAAYKHVPMMERNPEEAVKVNIFGTYNLAKAAVDCGVKKFIMISTDKAVRPTSIMGATKRVAEYVCTAFNCQNTEFTSVRFGNVLGSRGSVLPLFLEQLKHGGPLTVTHKDMRRYFMTISEAVSLVLQASVIGRGGEVLVLDMGRPIRIVELAEELIRIHGLEPYKDIDLEFIGLRPGEKLFEEILTAEEGAVATKYERIFVAKNSDKYTIKDIEFMLNEFKNVISDSSEDCYKKIKDLLKKYVKHFEEA